MAGGDGVLLDPAAGRELVEVVARFARGIEVAGIEHGRIRGRPAGGGASGNMRKRGNDERGKSHGPKGTQNKSNRMHLRIFAEKREMYCRACDSSF